MGRVVLLGLILLGASACASSTPRETRALTDDGVRLFRAGRYKDARETFEAALVLAPNEPNLLYNLGRCYERSNQAARAEKVYHQCLFRAPDHPECRHALTELMMKQNRQAEAQRMVEDWLARSPRCAAAYAEHGWLLRQAGDLPRAHARFQQAIEIDPEDRRALLELAALFEQQQQPERALVLYERADRAHPNHPDVKPRLEALRTAGTPRPRPE
jgi:tetratricopeptide (TPR) repeat protein